MKLSEIVDHYNLSVSAVYTDKTWTFSCQDLIKANGTSVSGTSAHPLDALMNMAKSASGRYLTVKTQNVVLKPIQYDGW